LLKSLPDEEIHQRPQLAGLWVVIDLTGHIDAGEVYLRHAEQPYTAMMPC